MLCAVEYTRRRALVSTDSVSVVHRNPHPLKYLTLCHPYLNPYCLGRKTAFFSVGI
jgi:hypothetical protein